MEFHRGRLFDHVHLRVKDLDASKRFYRAVLDAVGVPLAFQAKAPATVQRFHTVALAAGGRDNGGPGERPYHPGSSAPFVLDPDGNNIEGVFHGPARRSAASVVVTAGGWHARPGGVFPGGHTARQHLDGWSAR
jgi:lactoylglutathione lyase